MQKLLVNENFPAPSITELRKLGHDVVAVAEVARGSADLDVLARAVREERWLVTFDRDYGELVFARRLPPPPAVILLRVASYRPIDPARWLQRLCAAPTKLTGCFAVFDGRSLRTRSLPQGLGHGSI